jgi:acyl carrier protein
MESKQNLLARIRAHFPSESDPDCELREESVLADLGLNSLSTTSIVLKLQEEYALDVDYISQRGPPVTVGDLVRLVEDSGKMRG